mmetsp:Transcript_6193/g.24988  ORF Transcript_6193/g.24988 Transcript_6193/m.24988 type:complete len:300 (-) Transcript_6193:3283-4182(-)
MELQIAVQEQPRAAAAVGHDDALVGAALLEDDVLAVEALFGPGGQVLGRQQRGEQPGGRERAGQAQAAKRTQFGAEDPQRPDRNTDIEQSEGDAGAHQAELGYQQQREGEGHQQRAEVVEGQHLRDQVLQPVARAEVALQDAHHQRDFEAHQAAHEQHQGIEQRAEGRALAGRQQAVRRKQRSRHQPADHAHQKLHLQEHAHQLPLDKARQPGAQAHREEIHTDDGGELQHRVAEQVAGERARRQLVDQAAGGDDENAGEQQQLGQAGAGWSQRLRRARGLRRGVPHQNDTGWGRALLQ